MVTRLLSTRVKWVKVACFDLVFTVFLFIMLQNQESQNDENFFFFIHRHDVSVQVQGTLLA